MCVTEAGLPLTVCTLPSPQVIVPRTDRVRRPDRSDVRFNVYAAPSLTAARAAQAQRRRHVVTPHGERVAGVVRAVLVGGLGRDRVVVAGRRRRCA